MSTPVTLGRVEPRQHGMTLGAFYPCLLWARRARRRDVAMRVLHTRKCFPAKLAGSPLCASCAAYTRACAPTGAALGRGGCKRGGKNGCGSRCGSRWRENNGRFLVSFVNGTSLVNFWEWDWEEGGGGCGSRLGDMAHALGQMSIGSREKRVVLHSFVDMFYLIGAQFRFCLPATYSWGGCVCERMSPERI
jgi:hypothetical protein